MMAGGLAAALCVGPAVGGLASSEQGPQATTESGVVQGLVVPELPGGGAFLGIPYAAQPVGALRWRAPQAAPRWTGVRAAKQWGPACPQAPSPWLPEMLGVQAMATDEACLYVNVWTPALRPRAALPVFVWVHGGGNVEGSGEWPPLGVKLAQQGVVVVSLNYRLGVFGFLTDRGLAAESEHHASGNYGHLDQIAALTWVRRNIKRFGGDPNKVTIGGESSGALDVCNLMASPLAKGLFRGAILESGVCVDSVSPTEREEEKDGERLARDLGVAAGNVNAMRALPADRLMAAAAKDPDLDLEPDIDGWVSPQQPAAVFARGEQIRVPVLEGSNEDEITIFASPIVGGQSNRPKTVREYQDWLQRRMGKFADAVFAAYPATQDADVPRVFVRMDTDFDFGFGAWLLAEEMEQAGQKAYLYQFTYAGAGKFAELGAFHSEELMFLSGHYWTSWPARPEDAALSRAVVGYWAEFVKTGDPNGAGARGTGLPRWPAFSPGGQLQELGRHVGPEPVPGTEKFGAFQNRLTARLQAAAH
jgi:para-nitrobenzyl esterase